MLVFFRALQVIPRSPGLRSFCLVAQRPEGLTMVTRGHGLPQKKGERAEEQIEGSCLAWDRGTCSECSREGSESRDIFRTES